MMRNINTYLLLLVLFMSSCTRGPKDNVKPSLPAQSYKNVLYGTDTTQQNMDVYLPAGRDTGNTPVVILIHGGSWVTGEKEDFDGLGLDTFFNDNGCALVNMNYRLDGQYKYPAPIDDIDLVMNFIKQKAGEWKINPNRVCLFGKSAGSQLALIYAYGHNKDNRIKAVVDGFGPTDLTDTSIVNTTLGGNVGYMLGPYNTNAQAWAEASPVNYMQGAVPTIIFQGTADVLVYPVQSQMLQDSLVTRNVQCMYVSWQGDGHGWDQNQWIQWRSATMDWLRRFL
jgi:acetyl esterase/lipase